MFGQTHNMMLQCFWNLPWPPGTSNTFQGHLWRFLAIPKTLYPNKTTHKTSGTTDTNSNTKNWKTNTNLDKHNQYCCFTSNNFQEPPNLPVTSLEASGDPKNIETSVVLVCRMIVHVFFSVYEFAKWFCAVLLGNIICSNAFGRFRKNRGRGQSGGRKTQGTEDRSRWLLDGVLILSLTDPKQCNTTLKQYNRILQQYNTALWQYDTLLKQYNKAL